jgi:uncharacterized protein related to proFAR isomerase
VPTTSLEILPVVHARGGALVGPDAEPLEEDLKTVTRRFAREHDGLYLVDLDGLQRNSPDVELVQQVSHRVSVWSDAGSRTPEDVMDLVITGAEQVTVRHQTARDRQTLEEAVRLTENVALGLEFRDQELAGNDGWPATPNELVELAEDLGLPVVVVDHSRAGTKGGVDKSVAWHARHHGPGAWFAGGVADGRDLDRLEDLGYQGALVSTALIDGHDLRGADWSGPVGVDEDDDGDAGPEDPSLPGGFTPSGGFG